MVLSLYYEIAVPVIIGDLTMAVVCSFASTISAGAKDLDAGPQGGGR